MKKNLLLIIMCIPVLLSAQNGVTVSNLVVNAGTVTFDVGWDKNTIPPEATPWSDSVWVFVDYNDGGTMKRLPLSAGATLTETSAPGFSRVEYATNNNKGVWVVGNARSALTGVFSATVRLLTTVQGIGGACVYASNYPPVGRFTSDIDISFTGTPNYELTFEEGGNTFTLPSGGTYFLPADYTLLSFVDATGAPGMIISHVDYCLGFYPGVIYGAGEEYMDPSCAAYAAGVIGGEGFLLPSCPQYVPGVIGGEGFQLPSCAAYRAGSIGGLSFVGGNCENYRPGLIAGAGEEYMDPSCTAYAAGVIGGEGFLLPSCPQYVPGVIGGEGFQLPSCATYRAGTIGGLSFVGSL